MSMYIFSEGIIHSFHHILKVVKNPLLNNQIGFMYIKFFLGNAPHYIPVIIKHLDFKSSQKKCFDFQILLGSRI